jgi:hypothetical protein
MNLSKMEIFRDSSSTQFCLNDKQLLLYYIISKDMDGGLATYDEASGHVRQVPRVKLNKGFV